MTHKLDQARIDYIKAGLEFVCDQVKQMPQLRHQDDPNGLFPVQLVRHTFMQVFEHKFPDPKWMNGGLISRNTEVNEGATEYSYSELIETGEAAIISDNSTDLPRADIEGRNNILPVKSVGISIGYTEQHVRTARMTGQFDIVQTKVAAARRAHDRTLNTFMLFGVPNTGLRGVVRQPGIIIQSAVTGGWTEATDPDLIIADVRTAVNVVMTGSDAVEIPNTVLFPFAQWSILNRRVGDGTDTVILDVLKRAFPMIQRWDWDIPLQTADAAGTGPAMVVYRNDPNAMRAVFPMMMTPKPPQPVGLGFIIPFETRYGGVMTPRPRSLLRLDGI